MMGEERKKGRRKEREKKERKGRGIAGAVGQTGWPTAPIHGLNPLHHAAGAADPAAAYGGECRSLEFLSDLLLPVRPSALKKEKKASCLPAAKRSIWPSGRAPGPDPAGQSPGSTVWD